MHDEKTRAKFKRMAEDLLAGGESYKQAEERRRNERFHVAMWLVSHKLELRNGEDLVDLDARYAKANGRPTMEHVRGVTYFFDVYCDGQKVGGGHLFWFAAQGGKAFRSLDWRLFTKGGDTFDLGEELWRRAKLDRELPRQFRKGYRHPKRFLEALHEDATASVEEVECA